MRGVVGEVELEVRIGVDVVESSRHKLHARRWRSRQAPTYFWTELQHQAAITTVPAIAPCGS